MRIRGQKGQALMELAAGMFALALVASLLCVFVRYIAKSLQMENHIRSSEAIFAAKIDLEPDVAGQVLGLKTLHIKEPHGPTDRTIP